LATSATSTTGTMALSGSVVSFFVSEGEITIGPDDDMSRV
jgi:hypothetical protein